jgi:acetoacetyl-CoA synthetase
MNTQPNSNLIEKMMTDTPDHDLLWTPSDAQKQASALWHFANENGFDPSDYDSLHRWSIDKKGEFWSALWDFCEVIGEKGDTIFVPNDTAWMTGAKFFPRASLNLAENLLRGDGGERAIFSMDELGNSRAVSRSELRVKVAKVAKGLRDAGVQPGDRVAGIQPNDVDALVALLASLTIGATWTSCSPDFGEAAIIDRIGQVSPKVLFAAPRYRYGGKEHDISARIGAIMSKLPSVDQLITSGGGEVAPDLDAIHQDSFGTQAELSFERLPFDHPAYILYTSGTTGAPKAIVHRAGGVLLQHLKEHVLHGDVRKGDSVMWYTNTAWMMYHWLISALAAEATVILYDGAPILKTDSGLDCSPVWTLAEATKTTHLGISPKYLATLAAEGFEPGQQANLGALRSLLVCGAPTLPHQFDWVYQAIKSDMSFSSISGGTEILGSFLIGSPLHPVRRGQLTVKALGHAVNVFDDRGAPVIGQRGELVCTEPFPSMPLTFWGDGGDQRYHDTYFSERNEIWTHGDVAELTFNGSGYVHGRSDNTLKPGGVRIGISEIYAVCETYAQFEDFLVFGADHEGDEEVVLCLKPVDGQDISSATLAALRKDIRNQASPRHVPARIHLVQEVPYTINGKRVESAARTTLAGQPVKNIGSLANPQCLDEYKTLTRDAAL